MTRIAVLDDYQGRAHEFADWAGLGPDVDTVFYKTAIRGETLVQHLGDFEVLVLMRERTALPRSVVDTLPKLRLVVTTGMGNASVDSVTLKERGITFCGTRGGGPSTLEIAWGLILATTKRIAFEDRALRQGTWQVGLPTNLHGATLGLAGLGRLGAGMVPTAKSFDMDVIAWSQNLADERAAEVGVRKVSKEELLSTSDVLSIHLVLGDRTRGLFGAEELALMKPGAVLVNTSRGPIVDESALIEALSDGRIVAGLDVYDEEPLPADHPLLSLENTVLTPHLGYVSDSGMRAMYREAAEDIAAFLQGAPIRVVGAQ